MRIVAGEFKGRRLAGPPGAARPTSDKVREAIFSVIGGIDGARVLDLFAGSGALALEALSRGAAEAVLVERDPRVAAVAERNAATLLGERPARARVVRADVRRFVTTGDETAFDLIFIDPPYADVERVGAELSADLPSLLAPGGRLVAESDRRTPFVADDSLLSLGFERSYGDTLIRIFDAP